MRIMRCFVRIFLFIFFTIFVITTASVVAEAGIGVSPMSITLSIYPGETNSGSFEVTNIGEEPENIVVYLADWDRDIYSKNRIFRPEILPQSLCGWVSASPLNFELGVGETKTVKFSITVPKEESDPHWGMIIVKGSPKPAATLELETGAKINLGASLAFGVKVYQVNPAKLLKEGKITWFNVILPSPENTPLKLAVKFKNTGTTFLQAAGRVEIRNEAGDTIDEIEIESSPVLPGANRLWELTRKGKKLPPGRYLALAIFDFGGDYLVAGQRIFEIGED